MIGAQAARGIADEVGFSDLSHMTRAYRTSCGMPPSLVRKVALGDAAPELSVPSS